MVHTSNYHSGSHRNHSHNHGGHGGAGLYHSHSHRSHNHRHRHHHRDLSEDQPIFPSLCKYTIFAKIELTYDIANVVCNVFTDLSFALVNMLCVLLNKFIMPRYLDLL